MKCTLDFSFDELQQRLCDEGGEYSPPVFVPAEIVEVGSYEDATARLAILINKAHLESFPLAGEPESEAFLLLGENPYLAVVRCTGRFAMICPDLADDKGASHRLADIMPASWQQQPWMNISITGGMLIFDGIVIR